MAQRELKEMIGKRRVASQNWAVRIGTDYGAGDCTFGTVVAVADADLHRGKWRYARSEPGVATMILEAGDPLIITISAVPAADDLPNRSHWATGSRDVEESQSSDHFVSIPDGKAVAHNLIAGAYGEDGGSAVRRSMSTARATHR